MMRTSVNLAYEALLAAIDSIDDDNLTLAQAKAHLAQIQRLKDAYISELQEALIQRELAFSMMRSNIVRLEGEVNRLKRGE